MGWLARPQVATAAVNLAPWINGSPPKYVTAGSAYWFEPSSADLNGQTLKFSIIVVAPTSNSVTLSWRAPTQNVDGTGITDLMGYHVAYGTASRSYDTLLYIEGASITSAVIEGLPRGQFFCSEGRQWRGHDQRLLERSAEMAVNPSRADSLDPRNT